MSTLNNRYPNVTYGNLLLIDNSNAGIDGTLRYVQDGEGTNSVLQLSTTALNIVSGFTYNGNAISIAGALTFSGAYAFTATLVGTTSVTFPTSGTLIGTVPGAVGNVLMSNGSAWVSSSGSGGSSIIISGAASGTYTSTAKYFAFGGGNVTASITSTDIAPTASPMAGTISSLYVSINAADATDTLTLTLQVNGSDTALTCTVAATATTASDLAHSVSVNAGDVCKWKVVSNGSVAAAIFASVVLTAS